MLGAVAPSRTRIAGAAAVAVLAVTSVAMMSAVASAEGITGVEYRSTDKAGNVEQAKSVEVKIDDVAPETMVELDPADSGDGDIHTEPVTVTLTAEDGDLGSGVERIEYQLTTNGSASGWIERANNQGDEPFSTSFTVSVDGEHEVEFRTVHVAGNEEDVKSVDFTVEVRPAPSCATVADGQCAVDLSDDLNHDGTATVTDSDQGNFDGLGWSYDGDLLPPAGPLIDLSARPEWRIWVEASRSRSRHHSRKLWRGSGRMSRALVHARSGPGSRSIFPRHANGHLFRLSAWVFIPGLIGLRRLFGGPR